MTLPKTALRSQSLKSGKPKDLHLKRPKNVFETEKGFFISDIHTPALKQYQTIYTPDFVQIF